MTHKNDSQINRMSNSTGILSCTLYLHNQGPYETLRFVQKIIQKSKHYSKQELTIDYWHLN